ncbi:peroxiredoxin family protein [Roseimaritima ulvae]|uniref:Peroxiredoxin n=1 Tax=Roseimaritima ulvae TaxID=980254 RepID=A0A5B9QV04_9BACT|nr:peroxiredoxin family protein [Roseimaritima ulvae]QEG41185.1 Putative peroxiredoxin [Roseimaritima ulvae]
MKYRFFATLFGLVAFISMASVAGMASVARAADSETKPDATGTADTESAETVEGEEEEVLAGHSYHGDFLNEGPRQAAYLMGGTGTVRFPITSEVPQTQAFIEQGIGQLYGFWYLEAERSFRHAAELDPNCAIAYWGAALATKSAPKRARGFIAEAVQRKDTVSKRERMYIEALDEYLNFGLKKDDTQSDDEEQKSKSLSRDEKKQRAEKYTKALEAIALEYPDDIEAKAFLALQLYDNRGELPNPSYLAVDGLLDKVFAAEPMHSAHHFRIHLWDNKKAEMALRSAALCGPASPRIAHMWHMPGHIYSKLKRYDDAAWQQEASARVDHAHMIRDRVLPDQIHNFAHNNEWLIRNLNNVGRVRDAIDLAKNMTELPRHPKYNTLDKRGSAYYGRLRLIETLSQYEMWHDAVELCQQACLQPTDKDKQQIERLRLLGSAAYMTANVQLADAALADLQQRLENKRAEQTKAGNEAAAEATEKAVDKAKVKQAGEQARRDAEASLAAAAEQPAAEQPEDKESGDSEPVENETVAADELIAQRVADAEQESRDQQLKAKSKEIDKARTAARKRLATPINDLVKAVAQVEAFRAIADEDWDAALPLLEKASRNVSPLLVAKVRLRCGDPAKAIADVNKEVDRNKNEVLPLAHLTELQFLAGDWDAAKQAFERLQEISASVDMQADIFQRLDVVAQRLGYEADWRAEPQLRDDLGERPDLDSLGPFRWQPSPAPSWKLTDAEDKLRTLDDYKNRPLVVIFYLGFGCLHCAEQLQAFAPMYEEFQEQGIEVLAISTEGKEDLRKSVKLYDGKPFPFPLTSDAGLETFKAYRAYDDFEDQPLHGTFLIDGDGKVRWQDIGFEPFMKPQFLLDEATRLLAPAAKAN